AFDQSRVRFRMSGLAFALLLCLAQEPASMCKKLPVYQTTAPPMPEKAPGNVDLVTPERRKHILDGDGGEKGGGGHRPGTGRPGKTELPESWSDEKIIHEISDVATDPALRPEPVKGGRTKTDGFRDGVMIRVILDRNGHIITGYPVYRSRIPMNVNER